MPLRHLKNDFLGLIIQGHKVVIIYGCVRWLDVFFVLLRLMCARSDGRL